MSKPSAPFRYELMDTFLDNHKWGGRRPCQLRYETPVTTLGSSLQRISSTINVQRWEGQHDSS